MQFIEEVEATYHDRPELYQSFLNLLRTYQLKHMGLEGEVLKQADEETFCQELINLFSQDHNLLNTFTSLLPSTLRGQLDSKVHTCSYNKNYKRSLEKIHPGTVAVGENLDLPPLKKSKRLSSFRDASLAAAGQYGTLRELSFFDKVRRALRSQEVYENFLRCIQLYNIDIISVSDLLDLIKPFLGKFPELLIQFKHLVGKCFGMSTQRHALLDRVENTEMDFSSCKRLGPSYRALPESYQQPKCSGRTALCREVLNDIWVSFPSWSEDSTFVSSKKTQYEEHIYRCEDERFELDVVLETNLSTIRVLENVQKKLSRLTPEEQSHLHLDDCLGGTSEVIHCKALQRIYGDKAAEVIAGLKQNPANSIPVVLKRLKAREEEWREAQKGFNKLWREQNDRFYLRSLDPCGLTFRQLDTKALRSKSLLNQIEEAYDERQELMTTGQVQAFSSPHLSLDYPDHTLHTDATALLLHDLGSHTGPATAELQHTRDLLFVFLPTLLFAPQLNPEDFLEDKSSGSEDESVPKEKENHSLGSPCEQKNMIRKTFAQACNPGAADSVYSLFFANSTWYIFLRLHQILCTRLLYIREHAPESVPVKKQASPAQSGNAQAETAISPADTTEEKVDTDPEKEAMGGCGYAAFLALTRRLLDGEMEPSEYEDALRDLLTIHGFVAYTMDRLVHHACRQLQQLVCDEACMSLVKLHREARARGAGGGLCVSHAVRAPLEACYHRQAEQIVADDNCFKVMFIQSGEHVVMTMELLDSEEESTEDTFEIENWSNYVEHYTNSEDVGVEIHLSQKPIFLRRNLQRQQTMENMIAQWYRSKQRKSELNIVEDLEYRFRFNSFQLQFVANSEDYFYRRGSLHRASIGLEQNDCRPGIVGWQNEHGKVVF
uniref:paired amphipathic helix protein Sin3b-like isoform X2 n=1 Tax=Myxine glutinosa TaxID=7769 RepID=UPI00358FFED0